MIQIALISAEDKRREVKAERERIAEEERIKKEIAEREHKQKIGSLVSILFERCVEEVNKEKTRYSIEFTPSPSSPIFKGYNDTEIQEVFSEIKKLFEIAGYNVSTYIYSKGYQTRVNKIGYIVISW